MSWYGAIGALACASPERTTCYLSHAEQIMEASLQLGGTITSEHGVGLLKAVALRLELREYNLPGT